MREAPCRWLAAFTKTTSRPLRAPLDPDGLLTLLSLSGSACTPELPCARPRLDPGTRTLAVFTCIFGTVSSNFTFITHSFTLARSSRVPPIAS